MSERVKQETTAEQSSVSRAGLDATVYYCLDCGNEHRWDACPLQGVCLFCKQHPATIHFGDMLSLTHGGGLNCCALCCAEKQLAHAKERAALIPDLERAVEEARAALDTSDRPRSLPDSPVQSSEGGRPNEHD